MSVVFLTDHDENIYNCTKKSPILRKIPSRPVSKCKTKHPDAEKVQSQIERAKMSYATMGLPRLPLPDPKEFLRKATSQVRFEEMRKRLAPTDRSRSPTRLAPVPKLKDLLEEERKKKHAAYKNFVKRNIKKASEQKVKEPVPHVVYNRMGDKRKLEDMEPVYIYLPSMGKTPQYLNRFVKMSEKQMQHRKDTHGSEQPKCRYITKADRDSFLQALKQNWEELQKQYQGLPILIDTIPKINRKLKLEADLKQIEKDIVMIERHPYIYVYDDDHLD